MKIGVKIGDVMTRTFVSVTPQATVAQCSKEMISKGVGSLIVKEGQKLIGILTEGDIIRAIGKKKDLTKIKASDIMTRKVTTVGPNDDMYEALNKMKAKKVRWLPVTIKGRVIGLLTIKDVLVIEPSLFDIVSEFTPIKEEEKKLKLVEMRKKQKNLEMGEVWVKEGECQECEAYGVLYSKDGRLICEECKEEEE